MFFFWIFNTLGCIKKISKGSVKRLVTTRWSAHFDAIKVIRYHFEDIVKALDELSGVEYNVETRGKAHSLLTSLLRYSFLSFLFFWYEVLKEVNITTKTLQAHNLTLDLTIKKICALESFISDNRNSLVEKASVEALQMCDILDIQIERRSRKKKVNLGENAGTTLSYIDEIKRSMLECLDRFSTELSTRSKGLKEVNDIFSCVSPQFLFKETFDEKEFRDKTTKLVHLYDEINIDELIPEIPRLKRFFKNCISEIDVSTPLKTLEFIISNELEDMLPYLTLILKLYLTICVSVASCERSFSKLKLIKTYLRSTMSENRLNGLALLSIEKGRMVNIDFDTVIDDFALLKNRRIPLK